MPDMQRSSHPLRRLPSEDYTGSNASSSPHSGQANSAQSSYYMPSPERNQYSNRQSSKVNFGLKYSGEMGLFDIGVPSVDVDFSKLVVPIAAPEPKPTTEQLVKNLLNPPPHAFLYGVLSIQWVIGVSGGEHFQFRTCDERYVLADNSEIRTKGSELGMPAMYMEWLCGDDKAITATESNFLTPEFFRQLE